MTCCYLTRCKNMNYEHNLFSFLCGGFTKWRIRKAQGYQIAIDLIWNASLELANHFVNSFRLAKFFKGTITNIFILIMNCMVTFMWNVLLDEMNPQRISSAELYSNFQIIVLVLWPTTSQFTLISFVLNRKICNTYPALNADWQNQRQSGALSS